MLSVSGTAGQCSINSTSKRARKPKYVEFCCLYTFIWYNLSGVAMGIEAMGLWIFIDNLRDPSAKKQNQQWNNIHCNELATNRLSFWGLGSGHVNIHSKETSSRSRDENVILTTEGYFEKSPCRLQNSDLNCAPKWSWMMMRIEQLCMVKSSAYWSEHSNFARHFSFST